MYIDWVLVEDGARGAPYACSSAVRRITLVPAPDLLAKSSTSGGSTANAPQVLYRMVAKTTAFGAFAEAEMLVDLAAAIRGGKAAVIDR